MTPNAKEVALYGGVGGILIALLKVIEYKHFVREYPSLIYGGLVADLHGDRHLLRTAMDALEAVVIIREVRVGRSVRSELNAEKLKERTDRPTRTSLMITTASSASIAVR